MTLRVLDRLTDPGGAGANEDALGHSRSAAWVLDGATGLSDERLLPGPSDAAWLAGVYSRLLDGTADRAGAGLDRLLADVTAEAARAFEAHRLRPAACRFELPSAGLILARAGGRAARVRSPRRLPGDLPAARRAGARGGRDHRALAPPPA